ncbi:MAG TPA: hypothetical protein VMU45_02370 [Candidatus Eisenbacteria bacterium]|nr:hypothetical protein [Candidatus Eisenbacteria bacterium]
MAFDVKELMIDITKAGSAQYACHPTIFCGYPTFHCLCTYQITYHCFQPTFLPCKFGTYTCFAGSVVTCGGTIYCAGSNDPTILVQGIDRETLTAVKTQLTAALKEVDVAQKRLAESAKKAAK